MKFLIIGRTATGKDTLANILQEKYNWKFVKSYTTRPKRNENEDTHLFISNSQLDNFDKDTIIASAYINNYYYFATKDELDKSDAYIINPDSCYQLLEKLSDEKFIIVYIKVKDKLQQRFFALARNNNNVKKELEIFNKRYEDENKQFLDFEKMLEIWELIKYKNIVSTLQYLNTYNMNSLELFAESLNRIKMNCI